MRIYTNAFFLFCLKKHEYDIYEAHLTFKDLLYDFVEVEKKKNVFEIKYK